MKIKGDLTIEEKYLNLIHMCIYDVEKDKHGMITGISTFFSINSILLQFTAIYDNIDSDKCVFLNDFITGKMKFVLFTGGAWESRILKQSQEEKL